MVAYVVTSCVVNCTVNFRITYQFWLNTCGSGRSYVKNYTACVTIRTINNDYFRKKH